MLDSRFFGQIFLVLFVVVVVVVVVEEFFLCNFLGRIFVIKFIPNKFWAVQEFPV